MEAPRNPEADSRRTTATHRLLHRPKRNVRREEEVPPRKNASAWSNKQLYFNLFSDPDEEIEDELGLKYEFAFRIASPIPLKKRTGTLLGTFWSWIER